MNKYLLIKASDSHECRADHLRALAAGLVAEGARVTLFLVQNGVDAARAGSSEGDAIGALASAGVRICADEFSLAERGIQAARLAHAVTPAPLGLVVDELASGAKAVWF
jgi:intracellular sulfur oxidation DsrE/DsrF family protein